MSEKMPMEIWASHRQQDVGNRWTGTHKCYDDQELYHHDDKYRALDAENERLRAALEFYADSTIYYNEKLDNDCGSIAREVL